MPNDLARFVAAQDERGTYERALAELKAGAKRSHWVWFIFPQLAGLGSSANAQHYAIADAGEARAYLAHRLLGERLRACTDAMLGWGGRLTAQEILGGTDAMKFASSMTLFEAIGGEAEPRFAAALDTFYGGRRDPLTLQLLASAP